MMFVGNHQAVEELELPVQMAVLRVTRDDFLARAEIARKRADVDGECYLHAAAIWHIHAARCDKRLKEIEYAIQAIQHAVQSVKQS